MVKGYISSLKKEHKERLYSRQIRNLALGSQSQRERREREVEGILKDARNQIKTPISDSTCRLVGAALYWAEGTKGPVFEFTNSDPHLVLFMVKWVSRVFEVSSNSLKAQLNVYDQQNEHEVKRFWSALCAIPMKNFGKSYIKPANKGYKKNTLYYGTIKIRVPKGASFSVRVCGWIQKLLVELKPKVRLEQMRWQRLQKVPRAVNVLTNRP